MVMTPRQPSSADLTEHHTGEVKTIDGYTCKRAVIKSGNNVVTDLYYTDKITAKIAASFSMGGIKGFPMEYSVSENGLLMKMTAVSVKPEAISDSVFRIPADYKPATPDDLKRIYREMEEQERRKNKNEKLIEINR
jgi:hypothetical protein